MRDEFDPGTGELLEAPAPVVEAALKEARLERRERYDQKLGRGQTNLASKLAKAYAAIPAVLLKDADGADRGGKKIPYTTLAAAISKVRAALLAQRVIISQGAENLMSLGGGGSDRVLVLPVYTDLIDADSGEVKRTTFPMPLSKLDPQSMGSAITYGRRYSLLAALGIASGDKSEDDDGDAAMPQRLNGDETTDRYFSDLREISETGSLADYQKWIKVNQASAIRDLDGAAFKRLQEECARVKHKLSGSPAPKAADFSAPQPSEKGASFSEVTGVGAKSKKAGPKERIAATNEGGQA